MSFRRSLIALLAVCAFASSAFAVDAAADASNSNTADAGIVVESAEAKKAETAAQPAAEDAANKSAEAPAADSKKVNVNHASAKELSKVKGVSVYRARQLVSYRKKNGDFKSLDSLKEVKGFAKLSDDQLKQIQDQLAVE